MLAVTITASSRAAGGQARVVSLAPTTASARQRSRVAVLTPNRRARSLTGALSGGSRCATAWSLNFCPYRATSVLQRPQGS